MDLGEDADGHVAGLSAGKNLWDVREQWVHHNDNGDLSKGYDVKAWRSAGEAETFWSARGGSPDI